MITRKMVNLVLSTTAKPFAAIEFKAKKEIGKKDLSGIKSFCEEYPVENKILVCEASTSSLYEGIEVLSIKDFLDHRLKELVAPAS